MERSGRRGRNTPAPHQKTHRFCSVRVGSQWPVAQIDRVMRP